MASYVSKVWEDIQCTFPNRYKAQKADLSIEVLTMYNYFENEGDSPAVAGDVFDSATMNNLEARIASGFNSCINTIISTNDPTSGDGKNGDLFIKIETVEGVTSVVGLFIRVVDAWLPIATGGASLPQAEGRLF